MNQAIQAPRRTLALSLGLLLAWLGSTAGATPDDGYVSELLSAAEEARTRGHLIYPASGSAMSLYQEALLLAPDDPTAQRGLELLVEHFLTEASAALERDQLIKADSLLSKARMVDRDNPNIKPLEAELRLLEEATRYRRTLDWRLVGERSSELAPAFEDLGARARADGCRAVISASSDAEARWVYGQMSRAPGVRRIQAKIRIASPSAVEILCFPEAL